MMNACKPLKKNKAGRYITCQHTVRNGQQPLDFLVSMSILSVLMLDKAHELNVCCQVSFYICTCFSALKIACLSPSWSEQSSNAEHLLNNIKMEKCLSD